MKDLQGQGLSVNHLPSASDAWEDGDWWRKEKRASSREEEGDSRARGGTEINRHLRKHVVEMLSGCFATSNSPRVKDRARGLSAGRKDLLSLPASSSAGRGVTRRLHVLTAAPQAQAGPRARCILFWLPVTCHLAPSQGEKWMEIWSKEKVLIAPLRKIQAAPPHLNNGFTLKGRKTESCLA